LPSWFWFVLIAWAAKARLLAKVGERLDGKITRFVFFG
jgi:hypothetical protein